MVSAGWQLVMAIHDKGVNGPKFSEFKYHDEVVGVLIHCQYNGN
jgi:hypothetical protein